MASRQLNCELSINDRSGSVGAITSNSDDFVEARLMYREMLRVPFANSASIFVDHCDTDVGISEGDDGGSWSTC